MITTITIRANDKTRRYTLDVVRNADVQIAGAVYKPERFDDLIDEVRAQLPDHEEWEAIEDGIANGGKA